MNEKAVPSSPPAPAGTARELLDEWMESGDEGDYTDWLIRQVAQLRKELADRNSLLDKQDEVNGKLRQELDTQIKHCGKWVENWNAEREARERAETALREAHELLAEAANHKSVKGVCGSEWTLKVGKLLALKSASGTGGTE